MKAVRSPWSNPLHGQWKIAERYAPLVCIKEKAGPCKGDPAFIWLQNLTQLVSATVPFEGIPCQISTLVHILDPFPASQRQLSNGRRLRLCSNQN
jgi:hypothetical protein